MERASGVEPPRGMCALSSWFAPPVPTPALKGSGQSAVISTLTGSTIALSPSEFYANR